MNITKRFLSILLFAAISVGVWALEQDDDGYYLIGSVQDWKDFAALVNNDKGYTVRNVRMTADINLGNDQTMIGRSYNGSYYHYDGTFDGQGHTLTINYTGTSLSVYYAPFCLVRNCTIKNLKVKSCISSYFRDDTWTYVGGLVGQSRSFPCNIENCHVNVDFASPYNTVYGGLVSYTEWSANISDCLIEGTVTGGDGRDYCCPFIGLINSSKTSSINNSLSTVTVTNVEVFNGAYYSGTVTINNCFSTPVGNLGTQQCYVWNDEQLADGYVAYKLQDNREDLIWGQLIGTDTAPLFTSEENKRVYRGGTNGLTNNPNQEIVGIKKDKDGIYLISNYFDWEDFSTIVEHNNDAKARMTTDVDLGSIQAKIGHPNASSPAYYYKGTFDGQGHTLTVHYIPDASDTDAMSSPFPNISEATIKNLHIAGTLENTTSCHSAPIGMCRSGTSTIEKVWSSLIVNDTKTSWDEVASLVSCVDGYSGGNLIMTDCLFTGTINSSGSYNGCFFGYTNSGGSTTVSNCLSLGLFNYSGSNYGFTNNSGPLTNCYVKQFPLTIPTEMQVTDATLSDATDKGITAKLNNGRTGYEAPWVLDPNTNQPMLKIFILNNFGITTGEAIQVTSDKKQVTCEVWYSISGQKLSGRPAERGFYIRNGKKIVVN